MNGQLLTRQVQNGFLQHPRQIAGRSGRQPQLDPGRFKANQMHVFSQLCTEQSGGVLANHVDQSIKSSRQGQDFRFGLRL